MPERNEGSIRMSNGKLNILVAIMTLVWLMLAIPYGGERLRIISLSPSITEILFDIGAGDEVVGVTAACDWPPEVKGKPVIAGISPNLEMIESLNPDLILLEEGEYDKYSVSLERLGIRYVTLKNEDISDIFENILILGKLSGHLPQAEELAGELYRQYQETKAFLRAVNDRPTVLVVLWTDPLYTIGTDTFPYRFFSELKTNPIALQGDYGTVSVEWVLRVNPDYIIFASKDVKESFSKNPVLTSLDAWRKGRYMVVHSSLFMRGTPRTLKTFFVLARRLHGSMY